MLNRRDAETLARRLGAAANAHDIPGLMACYSENAVSMSPMFSEAVGIAAIADCWERLFAMMPDARFDASNVLVEGDRIAIIGVTTGTDRYGWFGMPPTGREISYRMVILLTVADGLVVRDERIYDSAGVLERLEKTRLDKELSVAADVQRTLLSRSAHVNRFCEAVGDSIPCRAIGGDFFELVELPSGDFGMLLGDVAGKGAPAALLAAMFQGMFAATVGAASVERPGATLARLNREVLARRPDARFVTVAYAVLSSDGRLVAANAGHNPPIVLAGGAARRLTAGGPPLGTFATAVFEEETLQLRAGDSVVMYTDGITEARSRSGDEFGEDRLIARLTRDAAAAPQDLLRRVLSDVRDFCDGAAQADDVTAAVTRVL